MSDDQRHDRKTGKRIMTKIALRGMLLVSAVYAMQAPLTHAQGS